jgi:hypothetical protein
MNKRELGVFNFTIITKFVLVYGFYLEKFKKITLKLQNHKNMQHEKKILCIVKSK